jgi:hypothetical protein
VGPCIEGLARRTSSDPPGGQAMQSKRYQVFVSSTYADLKDERRSVIETLLNLDCIPAGMEWFGAIDEEQFEYIKRVIDDCDYYVVIIGNRYGTLTAEGVSYTEKEYEYALSKKLKVVAFIHKSPGDLPAKHVDEDPEARRKLEGFRAKLEAKRLVQHWESSGDLAGKVATSMSKMLRLHPAVGWVRADQVATSENLAEVNELRKDNERLRKELAANGATARIDDIAGLDEHILVGGSTRETMGGERWQTSTSWREIFALVSPFLIGDAYENTIRRSLAGALCSLERTELALGYHPTLDESFQQVRVQLVALNLVEITRDKKGLMIWRLTKKGEALMLELNVVRTKPLSSPAKAPGKKRR